MDISIHRVKRVRVIRHSPEVSNVLAIEIESESERLVLSVFGLPRDAAMTILSALSDHETSVFVDEIRMSAVDYVTSQQVLDKMGVNDDSDDAGV